MYYKTQVGRDDTVIAAYLGLRVHFFRPTPKGVVYNAAKNKIDGFEITPDSHHANHVHNCLRGWGDMKPITPGRPR